MPGLFFPSGGALQIPVGGLRLRATGAEVVAVEVATDVWPHWLQVASRMTDEAEDAEESVGVAHGVADDAAKGGAMRRELTASMTAIAAQAFVLDAVYDAVHQRLRHPPTRGKRPAARHRWIAETLRHGYSIGPKSTRELRAFLRQLFQLRDWAVHPPGGFRPPVHRADIDAGVEWRYVAFSAGNSRNALNKTLSILQALPNLVKEREPEVRAWTRSLEPLLQEAVAGTRAAAAGSTHAPGERRPS